MRTRKALTALAGAALGLVLLATTHTARAQDVAAAANAFSKAQKAELAGDHDSAAELYELADSLAPAPEALRSALRARRAGGQLANAAALAEHLILRYPEDKRSKELAEQTLEEAKRKLVRFEIKCQPKACGMVMNGAAATTEVSELHIVYIEPGEHEFGAVFGSDRAAPKRLTGKAGDRFFVVFDAPPEQHRASMAAGFGAGIGTGAPGADERGQFVPGPRRGLPVWVFVTGAVITAGVGAVTVWSGLDVLKAHDTYQQNQTQSGYEDGLARQRRTNVLIGGTVVAGASTGVIALFTRWSGSGGARPASGARAVPRLEAGASVLPSGAGFTLRGTF